MQVVWVLQESLAWLWSPRLLQGSGCGCQHLQLLCLLGLHPSNLLLQLLALLFLLLVGSSEGQDQGAMSLAQLSVQFCSLNTSGSALLSHLFQLLPQGLQLCPKAHG